MKRILPGLALTLTSACGGGDPPLGIWEGKLTLTRVAHSTPYAGPSEPYPLGEADGFRWQVLQCTDFTVVEVADEWFFRIDRAAGNTWVFAPGFWRIEDEDAEPQKRYLAAGGELETTLDSDSVWRLSGEIRFEVDFEPQGDTWYQTTWTLTDAVHLGDSPPTANCGLMWDAPVPVPDHSELAGCTSFDTLDRPSDDRTVHLDATGFSHRCPSIAVGQELAFAGDFDASPLRHGTPEDQWAGAPANPILLLGGTGASFRFDRAGDYVFSADARTPSGVTDVGVVRVR